MALFKRLIAEWVGTFWLVFGGIESVVFATPLDIGAPGVALAFMKFEKFLFRNL
jgi:glycerol uptake facilitator-like aquaporin